MKYHVSHLGKKLNCLIQCLYYYYYSPLDAAPCLDWADKVVIPSRFSIETMKALASGVPTGKARDEVVKALSTLILVYTIRPTSNDYNTICSKLIKRHPVLKDHVGSGFVSTVIYKSVILRCFLI